MEGMKETPEWASGAVRMGKKPESPKVKKRKREDYIFCLKSTNVEVDWK